MTTPISSDSLIGSTVSQYEIVAKLGGGGMGVVYKARDTKLGRSVALKFLPPQWSHDESAKQRFVREAQAASATNHRNICVIHNIDQTRDGRLFIVMAYYEGETLKQKLEAGPLPIIEAVEIASEIADGLAKAHAQGVVHRDVKPGNLMITEDGVKILDFGLAKFADALQLTVPGSTIGTVAYMSPEQARGEEADARSDVWSLGIVMFEMLTGAVPFRGTYQEATFHAIKNEPLPSLRAARPDIPDVLERVVLKALEKDPEKRFQNAREPARDLKLLAGRTVPLDLQTIEVARPAGANQASLLTRRHVATRARIGIATAGFLLLVAAGLYVWLTRPIVGPRVAIVPVINQTGFAELDPFRLGLTQTLIMESSDSTRVRIVGYDRLLDALRRFLAGNSDVSGREAVQALTTASAAQMVVIPTLLHENNAWRARGEVRDPSTMRTLIVVETEPIISALINKTAYDLMASLAKQLDEYFVISGPRKLRWLDSLRAVGRHQRPTGVARFRDLDSAVEFERGLRAYHQMDYASARRGFENSVKSDPQSPLGFAWLSHADTILRQDVAARQAAERARQVVTSDTPATDVAFVEAVLAEAAHDYGQADRLYEDLSKTEPNQSNWLLEVGSYRYRRAAWSDAVTPYQEALTREPNLARPHLELCRLYNRLHEEVQAKQEGTAALAAYRSLGNVDGEAQSLMCMTDVLQFGTQQERAQAMTAATTAVRLSEESHDGYNLARAHYYVALAAEALGQPLQAVKAYEAAMKASELSENVLLDPLLLMNLGAIEVKLGQYTAALDYYQKSRRLFQQQGDEQRAAQIQANTGAILAEYSGRIEDGLRDINNALGVFRKVNDRTFEVFAAKVTAATLRYTGHYADAERELLRAISLAKERNMDRMIPLLAVDIAQSRLDLANYKGAEQILVQTINSGSDQNTALPHIYLAATYVRLGKPASAQTELDKAEILVRANGDDGQLPLLSEIHGEIEYQKHRYREARAHFTTAAAFWTDDLPDPAAIESRTYLGLLDAYEGRSAAGRVAVTQGLDQARKIRWLSLEARCRLALAAIEMQQKNIQKVLETLDPLSEDVENRLGPDLLARIHALRGQARAAANDRGGAERELDIARGHLETLSQGLDQNERQTLLARPDLQQVVH